jgi:TonB-dependent SusC/RagA subfamily outer membrane receptor
MKIKILFLILLSLLLSTGGYAQKSNKNVVVSGLVTDANQQPVKGVKIFVDNIDTKVVTDRKGRYKVKISPDAGIISTYTSSGGMTNISVNGQTTVDFTLPGSGKTQNNNDSKKAKSANTVPVESQNNGAMKFNKIEGDINKNSRYTTIYEMLIGTVPGVEVNGKQITIRGRSSFLGSTQPLFVVDGVIVGSIDDILPIDVKSIEVIKSSSAAIYGSRGSNGVIVIKRINASDIR